MEVWTRLSATVRRLAHGPVRLADIWLGVERGTGGSAVVLAAFLARREAFITVDLSSQVRGTEALQLPL